MPAGSTYVVGNGRISSFLWLNNISMFVCVKYITTFCPFICPCILRLFPFLGCCKKNAALNMRVQVSLLCSVSYAVFCFSFINTQMCNWLDHMVAVFFNIFCRTSVLFSKVALPVYSSTSSAQVPFFHVVTSIYLLSF